MALTIKKEHLEKIRAHGEGEYPRESCGLLIGRPGEVVDVVSATNLRAGEREDRYVIDPDVHLKADELARKAGLDVIGCYHSHPDWPSKPSANDLEDSWPYFNYIIASIEKGAFKDARAWVLDDSEEKFIEVELKIL